MRVDIMIQLPSRRFDISDVPGTGYCMIKQSRFMAPLVLSCRGC